LYLKIKDIVLFLTTVDKCRKMKYFFIVQGEGRGHMTQAISLSQILREAGHEIVHTVVGKSPQRNIPSFFFEQIQAPVSLLESPNFVTDKDHKSVKPFRTIIQSIVKSPVYSKSINKIKILVNETQPDVIINFYDFLGGIFNFFHRPKAKFICIAHQYLLSHPSFTFPEGRTLDKTALLIGNRITQLGADKLLCLSFQFFEDMPRKKIFVVPPLLREEIKKIETSNESHLLVYMVNPGYGNEVLKFHNDHPDLPLHCFWDKKDKPNSWKVDDTLTFHQLNDKLFLEKMASCRGYVSTAGFESICEAMYMGKPVLMIPVEGHYEQSCNAVDAVKAGAGISATSFSMAQLIHYLPDYKDISATFKPWADQNKAIFLKALS